MVDKEDGRVVALRAYTQKYTNLPCTSCPQTSHIHTHIHILYKNQHAPVAADVIGLPAKQGLALPLVVLGLDEEEGRGDEGHGVFQEEEAAPGVCFVCCDGWK